MPEARNRADIAAAFGATQHVVIARELTKLHEEFLRAPVIDLRTQLAARGIEVEDTAQGQRWKRTAKRRD